MQAVPVGVTGDPVVRARMERAAAAAQIGLEVTADLAAPGRWLRAPMVLLDAAAAESAAAAGLPRRERIVVLAGGPMTSAQWQACITLGADRVVSDADADYDVVRILTEAVEEAPAGSPGRVVAVIGACGGAGSSVFAAALALASGHRSLLVDADPGGSGLEVLLGVESVTGARWGDIAASRGRIPEDALWQALPSIPGSHGRAALLGFGPGRASLDDVGALGAVLDAARRTGAGAVVDLPRRCTEPAALVVARADLTVLVSPAEVRGCYAAARLLPEMTDLGARWGLVVRGPSPGGVGAGDIAAALSLPLIAAMRPQPGLAGAVDGGSGLGRLRGPLGRAARATWSYLEEQR